jgi:hypothetical protein
MPPAITLTLRAADGSTRRVSVESPSFSIGRGADNDLVIDDASLSRRHAVLTHIGGVAQVTDCGSRNGTRLNGRGVSGTATLNDGDVLTFGERCDVTVHLAAPAASPPPSTDHRLAAPPLRPAPEPPAPATPAPAPRPAPAANPQPPSSPNVPLIAGSAIVGILLLAVVVVIVSQLSGKKDGAKDATPTPPAFTPESTPTIQVDGTAAPPPDISDPQAQLERQAARVVRSISNEADYVFPAQVVDEIARQVEGYRTRASLAPALRSLDRQREELAAAARGEGVKPGLLVYLALAETDGGQGGDPAAAARRLLPDLLSLQQLFGAERADSCLIIVAASRIPGWTKKSHPLLPVTRRLVKDVRSELNVWFLREHDAQNASAYAFVVRFLALGVIAQNPRQYGVETPPLAF